MAHLFAVGVQYQDSEEVESALDTLNNELNMDFIIDTNNKKSIVLICKHGKKRKFMELEFVPTNM